MNIGTTIAATPWWGTALALAGVALFCTAGFWQLSRAEEKKVLETAFIAGGSGELLDGLPADAEAADLRYGRIRISGRFDSGQQVLLDNMVQNTRAGYQVLTPFRTAAGTVMVNRGWVPAAGDRRRLPDVSVGEDTRTLTGRLDSLPVPGLRLAAETPARDAQWPRVLNFPTADELGGQLGYAIRGYQLLMDADQPDGFVRAWKPREMAAEQHLAYAVQWFGLAAAVVVIYVILVLRRSRAAGVGADR